MIMVHLFFEKPDEAGLKVPAALIVPLPTFTGLMWHNSALGF
jgi:hypothetical protein